ncbi:MAG: flavin reductase [Lachnospiraceae bacterium]|nr:flavin reductase [Lachnospiraceae bacterium]
MDMKVMNKLSYGLFVLTATEEGKDNGCITNTAAQVTTTPNRVTIAVNKDNYTHGMIMRTKACNISIISEDAEFEMFRQFGFQSGANVDKFSEESGIWMKENKAFCRRAANGVLYIAKGCNAYLSLYVTDTVDLGTHTLFICDVVNGEILSEVPSATYAYYHAHIKTQVQKVGTTPEGKTVWKCKICGYEYVGDELPEDFICPVCKHPASDFEKI